MSLKRSRRITIPLKATHMLSGALRILLQDNSQVEIHRTVDEEQVCSTRPCGQATVGVDKGYTEALGDWLSVESDHRRAKGWHWPGIHGRLVVQLRDSTWRGRPRRLHDGRFRGGSPRSRFQYCAAFYNSQQRCR